MVFTNRKWLGAAVGAAAGMAATLLAVVTPASGAVTSHTRIHVARGKAEVGLGNGDKTLVRLTLPAGHWLITAKMWADSANTDPPGHTVVGCHLAKGGAVLDSSAFNLPGGGGSVGGVNFDIAAVTLHSRATISFQCNDFGSIAVAHGAVLSAVG
jgi:hypothetical protein